MEISNEVQNLAIMITEKCNHNCYHCFRPVTHLPSMLNRETLKLLSERIEGSSIKNVRFTGGEPLLVPDFAFLVKAFASKGFVVSVGTNATLLNEEMVSRLVDSGLQEIWTTIHSANPETHDRLAGVRGAFEKTVKAIEFCMNSGIKTSVNFPVSKYNICDLSTTLSFLTRLGVDRIKILKITPMGRAGGKSFEHLTDDEWSKVIGQVAEMDIADADIKIQGSKPYSIEEGKCYISPIRHLNINPLGKIYPCCLLNNTFRYEVGDISELISMDFNKAIDLFNRRIHASSALSDGILPCLKLNKGKNVCPLYSRHTNESDKIKAL